MHKLPGRHGSYEKDLGEIYERARAIDNILLNYLREVAAQKYIQMMEELAKGPKTKTIFLPYEATGVMGSIGGIKEMFKEAE